jgi:TRAP-type C4-dicarboxylate transport system substrate-binding protein
MYQKKWSLIVVVLAAIFLTGTLCPAASHAATTLTYSSFFPPTHIQSQLAEAWCQEVETRTEGRVTVQYFAGQTLTKAKQTYDSIVDGIADVGTSALAYTQGRFPVMGAIDLPFGYPSGVVATNAANALYAKFQPKEFEETQVMYFNAHGPGFVHTREKPAKSLDDLKGLKIRSTGMSADVMKALGATPVPMPMPDTYQSLQKGVVDGSCYPLEANKGWKLGEVVDYATQDLAAAYTTNFFVVMNKAKWDALDPKDQEIISAINTEWAVKHGEAWDSSDKEGLDFFLSQEGNEVIKLDEAESVRWGEAVAPLIENYAKDLDDKGLDGKAVVEIIRGALQ